MQSWRALLPLVLLSISLSNATQLLGHTDSKERFYESLTLKPLVDGKVSASFEFETNLHGVPLRDPKKPDEEIQHYSLYPLSLGQILRTYSVSELHLTLNAGKWDYDHWGLPHNTELGDVGTGATFWAWIGEGGDMSVDEKWKGLRNALSGLFCSSLGRMDGIRTTSPSRPILSSELGEETKHDSEPQVFAPHSSTLPSHWTHHLRHATLPSENVCTENLTPFLKLLPCKGKSGIASLLNPHKLFDANWHGLGVHVTWEEDSAASASSAGVQEEKGTVEVKLTFQAVLDPLRNPRVQRQDWSFSSLFDRQIHQTCPVASTSTITAIDLPPWSSSSTLDTASSSRYTFKPEPISVRSDDWPSSNIHNTKTSHEPDYSYLLSDDIEEVEDSKKEERVQVYWDTPGYIKPSTWEEQGWKNEPLDVGIAYPEVFDRLGVRERGPQAPISIRRTLTEKSQLSGRLDVEIVNNNRSQGKNEDGSIDIVYLETMPWIVQFYLHTLTPKINDIDTPKALTHLSYTPSIPHSRPTTFQASFHIPANTTLSFTMEITKAFLRYTEHPPDAQRGWDLPPGVVMLLEPLSSNSTNQESRIRKGRRMYTPTLLITLATPDFSMPYNVIIFTSTVAAFIFASVFNLLTRQFVIVKLDKAKEEVKKEQ